LKNIFVIVLFLCLPAWAWAQVTKPNKKEKPAPTETTEQSAEDKVTLERAESLEKDKSKPNVKKLIQQVVVKHKGSVLYCDSAYLYEDRNAVDTFGHSRLVSDNGTIVTADSMFYDGNSQLARAIGNVVLQDEKTTLYTKSIDYSLATGIGYYTQGGKIIDEEKTLESRVGSYDTNSKIFRFQDHVILNSKQEERKIETNDLTYNTISKLAFFQGPTNITTKDGTIYSENGTYNTETQISNFKGRTRVQDKEYAIEADTLYFDRKNEIGFAQRNVVLLNKKDSLMAFGDKAWFRGKIGESKVYGNALAYQVSNGGKDSLWIKADTLYAINRDTDSTRQFLAYHNVLIFRQDFQARCDSLAYNKKDSTLRFYKNPVLWAKKTQLSADTLWVQMDKNRLKTMFLRVNSFMVSQDTLNNFNQIKGKHITSHFIDNNVRRVEVRNNGESVYFAVDKDSILVGMNRSECSGDINIVFGEKNQIKRITQINKVEGQFVPPHELSEEQKKLRDFVWFIDDIPLRTDMTRNAPPKKPIDRKKGFDSSTASPTASSTSNGNNRKNGQGKSDTKNNNNGTQTPTTEPRRNILKKNKE
jgi:lipopolysaccharide assembly outer membrane protein LptD (OstA)